VTVVTRNCQDGGGGDVGGTPGGIVSRMILKVLACLERLHSIGAGGKGS